MRIFWVVCLLWITACQDALEKKRHEGQALLKSRQFAEAANVLQEVAASRPEDAEAQYLAGVASAEAGFTGKAQAYFAACVGKKPEHNQARIELGILCSHKKQWDCALEQFAAVLASEPRNVFAVHRAIEVHLAKGDLALARQMLDKAHILGIRNANTAHLEGQWLLASQKWPEAIEHLSHSAEQFPDQDFFHYYLAIARLKSGDREGCFSSLETAFGGGKGDRSRLAEQPEFNELINDPRFMALVNGTPKR